MTSSKSQEKFTIGSKKKFWFFRTWESGMDSNWSILLLVNCSQGWWKIILQPWHGRFLKKRLRTPFQPSIFLINEMWHPLQVAMLPHNFSARRWLASLMKSKYTSLIMDLVQSYIPLNFREIGEVKLRDKLYLKISPCLLMVHWIEQ